MSVTIKTVAQKLGCSVSTVSKAMNGYPDISADMKQRVLETARELGYTPSTNTRGFNKKSSNLIGVLVPTLANPLYGELFECLVQAAEEHGLNLLLCDTRQSQEQERDCIQSLLELRAMGLIIAPVSSHVSHITETVRGQVPVVYLGGQTSLPDSHFVSPDNRTGSAAAVEYLVSLGHRRIAMVADDDFSPIGQHRIRGYLDVMQKYHFEPTLAINHDRSIDSLKAAYLVTQNLFQQPRFPTAIIASNDFAAAGVVQAVSEHQLRIPQDVSIIGYDDAPIASLPMLNLTTVAQPKAEMAEMALGILLERFRTPYSSSFSNLYAKPYLVIRGSCGSCPNPIP